MILRRWPMFLLDQDTSPPSGGGAPAPSQGSSASPPSGEGGAPSTTKVDRMPDSPEDGGDVFAGMESEDFDQIELPPEEAPTGGEPGEVSPTPKPPTAPQPAAASADKVTPQQTPVQPVAPAQDVGPQPPRSPLDTAIEGFRTSHKEMSNWASTNLFALSKEDAEILETDAASFIPVLMGRVYSQALQATTNLIKSFVPSMINEGVASTTARQAKASEAIGQFYAAHPHLNPQQHGALVDKWARAFRAANPSASRADAIKFVGNAVSTEAGLAPAANGSGRAQRAAPFAPARPGTRAPNPSQPHDPYEGMDMDYDQ